MYNLGCGEFSYSITNHSQKDGKISSRTKRQSVTTLFIWERPSKSKQDLVRISNRCDGRDRKITFVIETTQLANEFSFIFLHFSVFPSP